MNAELKFDGKTMALPIIEGSEGEKALDVTGLRAATGMITYDPGYQNTGSCLSAITFVDGERGILRYRGIPVEDLAQATDFIATAYLLLNGNLPDPEQRKAFSGMLNEQSMLHEDMLHYFDGLPPGAHPMAILSTMVSAFAIYYPGYYVDDLASDTHDLMAARLISKIRTIAAFSYKKSIGEPFVYPRHDLSYCANFLSMMFSSPVKPYEADPETVRVLNLLLILHADHEQNCSTSTVRLVGSSKVNLYSSVCAGINALWGPLHGGANQRVLEMLERIRVERLPVRKVVEMAKRKEAGFLLYGFGHRVYKHYDPRAAVLKRVCGDYLAKRRTKDPLLDIALELEDAALNDDYFKEKKLYPNVDFYSGILYKEIGIPSDMFTVMFTIGRMPGWIAQWKEMHETKPFKIGRPRQVYIGPKVRSIADRQVT
jgi:citrate synthase